MAIAYRDTDWHDVRSEQWRTNRVRKTEPKRGKSWCDRCDRNVIGHGEKCSVCGFRDSFSKHQRK